MPLHSTFIYLEPRLASAALESLEAAARPVEFPIVCNTSPCDDHSVDLALPFLRPHPRRGKNPSGMSIKGPTKI